MKKNSPSTQPVWLMQRIGGTLVAVVLLLAAGCSQMQRLHADVLQQQWRWPLPLQLWLQVQPDAAPTAQDYLLVLQDDNGTLRASLFNPAGMPVARKLLRNGRWQNEGLLPPAPAANHWLTAIVRELTASPQQERQPVKESFSLLLADGSRLQVRELE